MPVQWSAFKITEETSQFMHGTPEQKFHPYIERNVLKINMLYSYKNRPYKSFKHSTIHSFNWGELTFHLPLLKLLFLIYIKVFFFFFLASM